MSLYITSNHVIWQHDYNRSGINNGMLIPSGNRSSNVEIVALLSALVSKT